MNTIITTIIATGTIGMIAGILLVIASKVMYVKVDERVEKLREVLPGANCGACGYSGCDGYAAALAKGEAEANKCPPGGEETYKNISAILGVDADGGLDKKVAVVLCAGDETAKIDKMDYNGISTCLAAEQMYGGQNACSYGCLGFGDCVTVCSQDAICITAGVARVNLQRCLGCGQCAVICPRSVITMVNAPVRAVVLCKNTEKGAVVRKKCTAGCLACTKCVKECPEKAITITDNLAVIEQAKCTGCGRCAQVCMTGCIAVFDYA